MKGRVSVFHILLNEYICGTSRLHKHLQAKLGALQDLPGDLDTCRLSNVGSELRITTYSTCDLLTHPQAIKPFTKEAFFLLRLF